MGKAYANRLAQCDRPQGDFYPTPRSLVWVARDIIKAEFTSTEILEPCCGSGVIVTELLEMGYGVVANDLYCGGFDYLEYPFIQKQVLTNPPFSLWDQFVEKAKSHADKIMFIGRLNYLGTHSRNISGIWDGLKAVYCFDRYVDYRTPERIDGLFHVGAMATGWFVWEKGYREAARLEVLDVQNYAKLGNLT